MMWCPSVDEVLLFHSKLIVRTGGADGVRSLSLIESALARFHASFGGVELYETVEEKAAAVSCGLIQNHGFVDGNKRIGAAVLLLILKKNGIEMSYRQDELVEIVLSAACSESGIDEFVRFIKAHRT